MTELNIHFSKAEFTQRQSQVHTKLAAQNLDGGLLFKIEDIYWLSGYDSDGFSIFGCMFIGADATPVAGDPTGAQRLVPREPIIRG